MADQLKLANQGCFPVYALAKEIVNHYRPFLDKLDLTYPQYLVMLVLWEEGHQTVSQLGEKLKLDSGTLTPLLKRMQQKDLIGRDRSRADERIVNISITEKGQKLKTEAEKMPQELIDSMYISVDDLKMLKAIIEKILVKINQNNSK